MIGWLSHHRPGFDQAKMTEEKEKKVKEMAGSDNDEIMISQGLCVAEEESEDRYASLGGKGVRW